jgi:hypothetical protein
VWDKAWFDDIVYQRQVVATEDVVNDIFVTSITPPYSQVDSTEVLLDEWKKKLAPKVYATDF